MWRGVRDAFVTGWVYSSDSSLNVPFSQDRSRGGPRWPPVWVPDRTGTWREAIPYMGFPGGKIKTIVVDLDALPW
ncbi:MAG: hypothetical protein HY815_30970 [Candidatus Riflebacteria bacterium]|nr:hypothetical protein [Candidatus Riflebacteria bacterium]